MRQEVAEGLTGASHALSLERDANRQLAAYDAGQVCEELFESTVYSLAVARGLTATVGLDRQAALSALRHFGMYTVAEQREIASDVVNVLERLLRPNASTAAKVTALLDEAGIKDASYHALADLATRIFASRGQLVEAVRLQMAVLAQQEAGFIDAVVERLPRPPGFWARLFSSKASASPEPPPGLATAAKGLEQVEILKTAVAAGEKAPEELLAALEGVKTALSQASRTAFEPLELRRLVGLEQRLATVAAEVSEGLPAWRQAREEAAAAKAAAKLEMERTRLASDAALEQARIAAEPERLRAEAEKIKAESQAAAAKAEREAKAKQAPTDPDTVLRGLVKYLTANRGEWWFSGGQNHAFTSASNVLKKLQAGETVHLTNRNGYADLSMSSVRELELWLRHKNWI